MADEKQYKGAVSTARQLCDAMGYPESEVERYDRIIEHFPMLITPLYCFSSAIKCPLDLCCL